MFSPRSVSLLSISERQLIRHQWRQSRRRARFFSAGRSMAAVHDKAASVNEPSEALDAKVQSGKEEVHKSDAAKTISRDRHKPSFATLDPSTLRPAGAGQNVSAQAIGAESGSGVMGQNEGPSTVAQVEEVLKATAEPVIDATKSEPPQPLHAASVTERKPDNLVIKKVSSESAAISSIVQAIPAKVPKTAEPPNNAETPALTETQINADAPTNAETTATAETVLTTEALATAEIATTTETPLTEETPATMQIPTTRGLLIEVETPVTAETSATAGKPTKIETHSQQSAASTLPPAELHRQRLLRSKYDTRGTSTIASSDTRGTIVDHIQSISDPNATNALRKPQHLLRSMRGGRWVQLSQEDKSAIDARNKNDTPDRYKGLPQTAQSTLIDRVVRGVYDQDKVLSGKIYAGNQNLQRVVQQMHLNGTYYPTDAEKFVNKVASMLPSAQNVSKAKAPSAS